MIIAARKAAGSERARAAANWEVAMTHIETSRVNEVMGIKIGTVQEAAHRLSAVMELEELELGIAELEKCIADLKESLAGLPYKRVLS